MRPATSPPRLARALLARLAGDGARGRSIVGDLHEEWTVRGGSRAASAWYCLAAVTIGIRLGAARLSRERGRPMMDLRSDLKTAWRAVVRNPGTSSLIVATLALAIGTATVGFTFADLALFRGLPVDDASRVVSVMGSDTHNSNRRAQVSGADFLDYRTRSRSLERLSVFRYARVARIEHGESRTLEAVVATADFFEAMGQRPVIGRGFFPGEDQPGSPPVVVLSDRYWREAFSARESVLGTEMQIGRQMHTVVGVLSPEMEFGNLAEVDVWLPLHVTPDTARDQRTMRLVARLAPGATFDSAAAEIAAIGDALAAEHPETNRGWRVRLIPIRDLTGGEGFWVVVALFLLSVGLLIAIATANVSNLVLVRAAGRQREMAVRTALGAPRQRLVRQMAIEGLLLSALGSILALPVALLALRLIAAFSSELVFRQLAIDAHEIGFVSALMVLCPLAFSLMPARAVTRMDVRSALSAGGGRGATAPIRGRGWLVVAQIALAVVLLTASSLALRSIRIMYAQPTGLQPDSVLTFTLDFDDVQYPEVTAAQTAALATRDRLAALPGVERAGLISALPVLGSEALRGLTVDGMVLGPGDARPSVVVTGISADGGAALGLTMLAGRWWDAENDRRREGVVEAVVSRQAAVAYLGGIDQAVGRTLAVSDGPSARRARVVGVSNDVLSGNLDLGPPPRVWLPLAADLRRVVFLLRSPGDPAPLVAGVRAVVAETAPAVPIELLSPYDDALRDAASSDFVIIGILSGFALLALVLAATGLFGVVSYTTSQRTAEFGTRVAIGARSIDLVRLVARDAARFLLLGLAAGLAGGIGVGYLMRGMLYRLAPTDPVTIVGVTALLSTIALVAVAAPALRAANVDPLEALRGE